MFIHLHTLLQYKYFCYFSTEIDEHVNFELATNEPVPDDSQSALDFFELRARTYEQNVTVFFVFYTVIIGM